MKPAFFKAYLPEFQSTFIKANGSTINDREVPLRKGEFGSMPLIVLTASRHRAPLADFIEADQQQYYTFWKRSHDQLAAMSTRGVKVVINDSGHFIQRDAPGAVNGAVEGLVRCVRSETH